MEQDKLLQELLLLGIEKTSPDFTKIVMQQVSDLAANTFSYQPLVSPKLVRFFLFIFGSLTASALGLCLLSALGNSNVLAWMQNINLPDLNPNQILIFIGMFWIFFFIAMLLEKRFIHHDKTVFLGR